MRLGGSAVVGERAETGVGAADVTRSCQCAAPVAVQVVAERGWKNAEGAIPAGVLPDDRVLQGKLTAADNPAAEGLCPIAGDGRVRDGRHGVEAVLDAGAGEGRVAADRAVCDGQRAEVPDAASCRAGRVAADRAPVEDRRPAEEVADPAARDGLAARAVLVDGALVERQRAEVCNAAAEDVESRACVVADGAVVERERAAVQDAPAERGEAVLGKAVLDRDAGDPCRDGCNDLEDSIEAGAVDDRGGLSGSADGQIGGDVEVTGRIGILARAGEAEEIRPRRHHDRVGSASGCAAVHGHVGVGGANRLAQGAVAIDRHLVGRCGHSDCGCRFGCLR